jgi:hypothetical protein
MSRLMGVNTVMSTWRGLYPLDCPKNPLCMIKKLREALWKAHKQGFIKNPENYEKFITSFATLNDLANRPYITVFAFTNDIYDLYFSNLSEFDKTRIAKAHTIEGLITDDLLENKTVRLRNLSRMPIYVQDWKIYDYSNVSVVPVIRPVVTSNIVGGYNNEDIKIFFIDFPIYNMTTLYNDMDVE